MNVVLNVACDSWYPRGQQRLLASLVTANERASHMMWTDIWPGHPHQETPYGFKIDAFRAAQEQYFDRALWCDASVWAVRPLDPIWDYLDQHGVLLLDGYCPLGQWTSDHALEIFGISRDAAMEIQLTYNIVVGIDLDLDLGREFLERWQELRDLGTFVGPWNNDAREASSDPRCLGHRHDQSAASWLAHDMGIPLAPMEPFLGIGKSGGDPVLRAQGM
jgi:hypothetical protein